MMPIAAMRLARAAGGGGGPGGAGWNPADALSGHFAFANSNRTASSIDSSTGSVRAVNGRSTGLFYFECLVTIGGSSNSAPWGGLGSGTMNLTGRPGFDFTGDQFIGYRCNGQRTNDGGFSGAGGGSITATNGVTGVLGFNCDLGSRSVDCYLDGSFAGTITYSSGAAAMYPFCTIEGAFAGGSIALRTLTSEFTQTPLGGYSPWEP